MLFPGRIFIAQGPWYQARSQVLNWGCCFGNWNQTILTQILIDLWSDWVGFPVQNEMSQKKKKKEKVFTQIQSVFWPTLGDVKKKTPVFWSEITAGPLQLLIANPSGGIFIIGANIGLKSAKNVVFYILFRPMGELESPAPLATLLPGTLGIFATSSRHI